MIPLIEHSLELKWRIIYLFIGIIFYFIIFYSYSVELFYILAKPLLILGKTDKFIYTNLIDIFLIEIKLAVLFTFLISFLLIIYNLFAFVVPGLYFYEFKNLIKFFSLIFSIFFILLLLFYYILVPVLWYFLLMKETVFTSVIFIFFEARISEYFSLIFNLFFLFIFFIQIPFLIILFYYFLFLNYNFYKQYRLFFILLCFLYISIFSPPDFLTQLFLLFFLIFCVEICIFFECIWRGYKILNK